MKNLKDSDIENLKILVEKKFGQNINYAKDCQALSITIFNTTHRQVSASTLKRLFGIVTSKFNPSGFTLDTLALYIEFENWKAFEDRIIETPTPKKKYLNPWFDLKEKYAEITEFSLHSIKNKMKYFYESIIERKFAEIKIENFLSVQKTATAFIAPSGFGKSAIILKLIDKYWNFQNPIFPEDIILLVDCANLDNLLSKDFDFNDFFIRFSSQEINRNPLKYFEENPKDLKGRLVIILDSFDDVTDYINRLDWYIDSLLNLVTLNYQNNWFKVIITCRPNIWKQISYKISSKKQLINSWYDVNFEENHSEITNIPMLSKEEVKQIIEFRSSELNYQNIVFNNPELAEILSIPFFLYLYLQLSQNNKIISDIDLLSSFVNQVINNGLYGEGKSLIINSLLKYTYWGLYSDSISKNELSILIKENIDAYSELLSHGIIYEYNVTSKYLTISTYVKFSQRILFEFLLTILWLREFELSMQLVLTVIKFYKNNIELEYIILKWLIKFAFKEEKLELLKGLFELLKNNFRFEEELANLKMFELISIVGQELRKYQHLRNILIPIYAESETGQKLYFEYFVDIDFISLSFGESINYYLQNAKQPEKQIFGNCLKFLQFFFINDIEDCKKSYQIICSFNVSPVKKPLFLFLFYFIKILYQKISDKKLNKEIIDEIYNLAFELNKIHNFNKFPIPDFHSIIIHALNICNFNEEIIEFVNKTLPTKNITQIEDNSFKYMSFLQNYAVALLDTGNETEAIKIYKKISFHQIPPQIKYISKIRQYISQIKFMLHMNKLDEIEELKTKVLEVSDLIKINYFKRQLNYLIPDKNVLNTH